MTDNDKVDDVELNGYDDTYPFTLECGHKPFVFDARRRDTDERVRVPIGTPRFQSVRATLWCPEHGWVKVNDAAFNEIRKHYGVIA